MGFRFGSAGPRRGESGKGLRIVRKEMEMGSVKKSWLVLGAVFLFMLLLNVWMPLHRDDYDYSLIWGTTQHMTSFSDVLVSLRNHYITHGVRGWRK